MKKLMTVFAVVALIAVIASPALAYRGMGGPDHRGPFHFDPADTAGGINLTAEQTEKINALREAHFKELKPIKDQIYTKRGDLRILWLAKDPDKEKIINLQKEVQNLRGQMMEKATNHRLEVRKILTPEQFAKVQPYCGMGWHMAQGGAGMKGMSGRAGMDRACCEPGIRGGQPPCAAGMERPCSGAGMGCGQPPCGAGMERPCGGAGMGCGQSPCRGMR